MRLKQLVFTLEKMIKEISSLRFQPKKKQFLHRNVPYFSQWESKDLVKDIIARTVSAQDDPLWRKSGAKTKREYELWSWNGCGMACLKMILAFILKKEIPLVKLGTVCQKYGGYLPKNNGLKGLFYKPFLTCVKREFGLNATIIAPMVVSDIIQELEKGNFVIASVHPDIRTHTAKPSQKGGHLVLMLGYDMEQQSFSLHNPSGTTSKTQEYFKIPFTTFCNFFAYRGIAISISTFKILSC